MYWIENDIRHVYQVVDGEHLYVNVYNPGEHHLCDSVACAQCRQDQRRVCVSLGNLVLYTTIELQGVELNEFITSVQQHKRIKLRKSCDYVLEDIKGEKIVFGEFTCRANRYIEPYTGQHGPDLGKRAKAYEQIKSLADFLLAIPNSKTRMNQFNTRVGLFAWRDTTDPNTANPDPIEEAINAFITHQNGFGENYSTDMGNGFKFVIVKYPTVYKW